MFLTEFFTILVIVVAVFTGYKFRHEIIGWTNRKPSVAKSGILRDLEVLKRYKVDDAIERIVVREKEWEESQYKLEKELRVMKTEIKEKDKPKAETGET